jgi:hypothetical protein
MALLSAYRKGLRNALIVASIALAIWQCWETENHKSAAFVLPIVDVREKLLYSLQTLY